MTYRTLAALVLAAAAATGAPAHAARADIGVVYVTPEPATGYVTGFLCGMATATDQTTGPVGYVQTGVVFSGPVTSVPNFPTKTIEIRCTIQNAGDFRHVDQDATTPRWGAEPTVAALAPAEVTYLRAPFEPVYLCTQVRVYNTYYYWDGDAHAWSLDPTVPCAVAVTADYTPPLG